MDDISLVIDSLFLANNLTALLSKDRTNERLRAIVGKAWDRHWRRVKMAKKNGYSGLEVFGQNDLDG